eukprot:149105-Pyramimonas_sp.AAC.1
MVDAKGAARGRPIGDSRAPVSMGDGPRSLVGLMSVDVRPWRRARACPLGKVVQSRDIKVALAG